MGAAIAPEIPDAPEARLDYELPEATSAPRPSVAPIPVEKRVRRSPAMTPTAPPTPSPEAPPDSDARPVKLKTKTLREIPYRLDGEMFFAEVRKNRVTIKHPRWSLMGVGKNLGDAEIDLRREAAGVMRVYGAMSPRQLDDEAARQLAFALRVAIP